jgi:uncharacterized membrane protein
MFLDNLIPRTLIRLIAGVVGIAIGLLSIGVPLNFYLNLFSHPAASHQGQYGFWDGVSGSMIVLIFFAVFGFVSLLLIKFALTHPETHKSPTDESSDHDSATGHPSDEHATQD